jgi:hypothetical protein
LASLPCVVVGSGLPPSAQTSRSIISFKGEVTWYQFTGVTIMMPCAATHIGKMSFIQSCVCPSE